MEEESNASMHTKEVTRLWRSWRTIHEMVQDRVRKPSPAYVTFSPVRCWEC
jgi:hypothetical protein